MFLQVVVADMSDPSNLKRYDFLQYITQTSEYNFFDGRKTHPDMPETHAAIKRFFNAVYLTDFLEKVLDGSIGQSVRSENEIEIEIEEPAVKNSLQGELAGFSRDDTDYLAESEGALKNPLVVKLVGSDFNRRSVKSNQIRDYATSTVTSTSTLTLTSSFKYRSF